MSHYVNVTRDGTQWLGEVPSLAGAHSYAGNLVALDERMREVIALVEDLPEGAEAGLALAWDYSAVGADVVAAARVGEELPRRDARRVQGVFVRVTVCARRDLNPHVRRHQDLNLARLPITPLARPHSLRALPAYFGSIPRSRRSLATWPVARTLYCASCTFPCGSMTTVDRMTPVTVRP